MLQFSPLAYWLHNLDPDIVRFSDTLAIRWYGLAYVLGFVAGAFLLRIYYKRGRSPLTPEMSETLMLAIVAGVFIGGRLGYMLLYDLQAFLANPLIVIKVWDGGMASHGGFIGVCLAVIWFAHRYRIPALQIGDIIATLTPPGLFFGRIANFINGELWGKPTSVAWGVLFPNSPLVEGAPAVAVQVASQTVLLNPRHPSQLYEAVLEGLLLLLYTQWRFWSQNPAKTRHGQIAGEFFIGYAIIRIFCEHFREPDAGLIAGLSRGSFYSVFLIITGIGFIIWSRRRNKT